MKYVAGIDGGETRTTVICSDRDGRMVASEEFGSFNIELKLPISQMGLVP